MQVDMPSHVCGYRSAELRSCRALMGTMRWSLPLILMRGVAVLRSSVWWSTPQVFPISLCHLEEAGTYLHDA